MLEFDINEMREKYIYFANDWFKKIYEKYNSIGEDIKLKLEHGLTMSSAVANATKASGFFNDTYIDSAAVDGLLHDIGRFEQYYIAATLKDDIAVHSTSFPDHGKFGEYILKKNNYKLLREFLGENELYDDILTNIVGNHTTNTNPNYDIDITELTDVFQEYNLKAVLYSLNEELINKLIAIKLKILKEQDSLEILHQVRDGLFKPLLSSETKDYINDEAWNLFLNQEYINMASLREKGLWSCNIGLLVRYSLLYNNINFVGTLKEIIDDNLIGRVYQNQIKCVKDSNGEASTLLDPKFILARDYIELAVENLILTSPDGKIVTPESRREAKIRTLNEFNR